MNPYVIMTDTTADLPESYIREHGLSILSLNYILDGQTYDREHPLDVKEFYEKMRAGSMPTTSQVNPEQAKTAMCACLETGQDVLYIAFSSGLSGTYNSGRIAAEEIAEEGLFPERKVVVVDSLSASLGEGLLVHKAVMLKEAGKSLEEVADWVERNKLRICHNFTVDDLFHLYRGGRVSRSSAVLGSMVGIKPIIRVNEEGKLEVIGKVRGRKKAIQTIIKDLMERIRDGEKTVFISHGDCLEEAEAIKQKLITDYGMENVQIEYVGPVIGAHTGVGVLAVFALANSR